MREGGQEGLSVLNPVAQLPVSAPGWGVAAPESVCCVCLVTALGLRVKEKLLLAVWFKGAFTKAGFT